MKSYEFKFSFSRSLICHALNASNVIILRAKYMYVHTSLARSLACKSTLKACTKFSPKRTFHHGKLSPHWQNPIAK